MRFRSLLLALPAALFLFASCGEDKESTAKQPPETPAAGESKTGAWPATLTSEGGSYEVTIKPEGDEIVRNRHFSVDVQVAAKSGGAEGLTVKVDADMPAHGHGMNTKPELSALEGGGHRVEGMLFHMGGDWVITVDITRDGETERATFPVSVE